MHKGRHYHEKRLAAIIRQAKEQERQSILGDLGTRRISVSTLREIAAFLDGYQAAFVASAGRTHPALVWRGVIEETVKLMERMEQYEARMAEKAGR